MPSTTKDQPVGPLHNLRTVFKEIFGKQNDAQKPNSSGREEKSGGAEREKYPQ